MPWPQRDCKQSQLFKKVIAARLRLAQCIDISIKDCCEQSALVTDVWSLAGLVQSRRFLAF